MTKSDFAIISFGDFGEQLGARREVDRFRGTTFVGDQSSLQEFAIDGLPLGRGYVLVQTAEIEAFDHDVLLNGEPLNAGVDLPAGKSATFQTPMALIGERRLRRGKNTLQIRRGAGSEDSFAVYSAVVHWRERDPLRALLNPAVIKLLGQPVDEEPEPG